MKPTQNKHNFINQQCNSCDYDQKELSLKIPDPPKPWQLKVINDINKIPKKIVYSQTCFNGHLHVASTCL